MKCILSRNSSSLYFVNILCFIPLLSVYFAQNDILTLHSPFVLSICTFKSCALEILSYLTSGKNGYKSFSADNYAKVAKNLYIFFYPISLCQDVYSFLEYVFTSIPVLLRPESRVSTVILFIIYIYNYNQKNISP